MGLDKHGMLEYWNNGQKNSRSLYTPHSDDPKRGGLEFN